MTKIAGLPQVTVRAPGKVNLELTVGPPDDTGMHPLATVFQAVSLYEKVTASLVREGNGITLSVSGRDAGKVPLDESNIAYQAALKLAHVSGLVPRDAVPNLHLHIEKEIPVGGGMAGGSADAAATLLACNELWRTHLKQEILDSVAAELGADATFCLHGGTAVGRGYGEQLAPVLSAGEFHWLFALSTDPILTGAAYRELDALERELREPLVVRPELMHALRGGDPVSVGRELRNDFQDLAMKRQPRLREIIDFVSEHGAAGAIVSGSGPTVAILAPSLYQQREIKAALAAWAPDLEVLSAMGPAHGARVVGDT